ncbi:MAG: tRNA pseudouridine(38-40) synthase TruA [Deltaproteobacteria bacterium]|nr:MAG: tRNA pseudouridine(38-40) synthase TruA [Deltaproteobacteria bacterium]
MTTRPGTGPVPPRRWRLELAWDGRAYAGWQVQPAGHGRTIQQVVEEALQRVLGGASARVEASGRTDAGVHALQQVAAFTTSVPRTERAIVHGLNHCLPPDIACLAASPAPIDFDPRRWTRRKRYRYRILTRPARCPFRHGQVLHLSRDLDLAAMQRAARHLVGRHDMQSFRAAGCSARTTVRTLTEVAVIRRDDELHIEVQGNGFLRHQVRIMAGTLVEVGRGRISPDAVSAIIAARRRSAAGPTLPAAGLWLVEVDCPPTPRGRPTCGPGAVYAAGAD